MEEIEKAYSDYRRAYFRRQNEVTSRLTTLINISGDETTKRCWLTIRSTLDALSASEAS